MHTQNRLPTFTLLHALVRCCTKRKQRAVGARFTKHTLPFIPVRVTTTVMKMYISQNIMWT